MTPKKKTIERKRTTFPRAISYTTEFSKDWDKIDHSGKHDMNLIKKVISLLFMNEGSLPAEWKDHKLHGEFDGFRECHVKGDLLLIYQIHKKSDYELVVCYNLKTHSEAF